MPRKKKTPERSFMDALMKIKRAGITSTKASNTSAAGADPLLPLEERIGRLFDICKRDHKATQMISFIMYDIENNKIRNYVAKYLEKKGCIRVQKSIFLANLERVKIDEIHKTLREVQEMYENFDSIFLVPVSTDELRAMKVIGQKLDLEFILEDKTTLFF